MRKKAINGEGKPSLLVHRSDIQESEERRIYMSHGEQMENLEKDEAHEEVREWHDLDMV